MIVDFNSWLQQEATLHSLHQSAVAAFPGTRRRQHVVGPIEISELSWTPFLGVRTLFVRGKARNEDREYRPMILFKNVRYLQEGGIALVANDQKVYRLHPLAENDVLLRCDCMDFHWRFNYYDSLDRSLYGRVRKKYEGQGGPPANPMKMPGMCKHLMALRLALADVLVG